MLENLKPKKMTDIPFENIAKHYSGEYNSDDADMLEKWKAESPENIKVLEQYAKIFSATERINLELNVDEALKNVSFAIEQNNKKERKLKPLQNIYFKIAASVVVLLVSGVLVSILYLNKKQTNEQIVFENKNWEQSQDTLPDGTIAYLNKNSRLIYPSHFQAKQRVVLLEGEAFFEVQRNEKKPFVVKTAMAEIQVLGTSFNVNAYNENDKIEVCVASGSVQVKNIQQNKQPTDKNIVVNNEEKILEAGSKAIVTKGCNEVIKSAEIQTAYLNWRKEKIIFEETTVKEVIEKLEQIYQTKIIIANNEIEGKKLTAKFSNQSIETIIEVINTTFYPNGRQIALTLDPKTKNSTILFGVNKKK